MVGMAHYADPTRCPDCFARITTTATSCSRCGLPLRGEQAVQLFATLTRADELLVALRRTAVRTSPSAAAATVDPAGPVAGDLTGPAAAPAGSSPSASSRSGSSRSGSSGSGSSGSGLPSGLTVASVPQVLLGLGAACLLVAALVFLAVTWSVLGVGGRTATLVGFTVVAGVLAAGLARRGLRAAAESLTLVALGLLTLDLFGANSAGWLGQPSPAVLLLLAGALLAVTASAAALAVRRTPVGVLTGAEIVAVLGTALLALGVDGLAGPEGALLVLATVLPAVLTLLAHRLRLRLVRSGAGTVALIAWLGLTGYGLHRALASGHGWTDLWLDRHVWPLLAAAALAASPTLVSWLPRPLRKVALAVAHLLLTLALLAPTFRLHPTTVTLVLLAVLAGTGLVTALLPRPWALAQSLTQGVAATVVLTFSCLLLGRATVRLVDAAEPVWGGRATDLLPSTVMGWSTSSLSAGVGADQAPAAWLLPLCVLALLGTVLVAYRALKAAPAGVAVPRESSAGSTAVTSPAARSTAASRVAASVTAASAVAASVVAAVALYPVPLWLVLAALVSVALGFCVTGIWFTGIWTTGIWTTGSSTTGRGATGAGRSNAAAVPPVAASAGFLSAAVLVSLHAELLTALVLCAALLMAVSVALRAGTAELAGAGGLVGAATLAGWVWAWGAVADLAPAWAALSGLVVLGATVLLAPYLPAWWPSSAHRDRAREGTEIGAACSALGLAVAGVALAPGGEQSVWTAVYLTVAGAVVTAVAVLRPERRALGWLGGALLAAATWVRLEDLGVTAPEPYTLPTAVALLLVGLRRLQRDPASTSMATLAPGLTLALVPTLLWALDEPGGVRALLLGLGCVVLVLTGARTGWTAPLVLGAGVGAALLLRLATPYIGDAVPRWVLIGGVGVLLLAVGTTWERRVAEARAVLGYVRALR